jgi:5S rRNA maturation endonuclease (ribonuclease M5)
MRADDAKRLPLDRILSRLGFSPVASKKNGRELWYTSPFREEKEASLHISTVVHPRLGTIWVWNDFADVGGNVIDFALRYFQLPANDVSGALNRLSGLGISTMKTEAPSPSLPPSVPKTIPEPEAPVHSFTDVQIEPLQSRRLIAYLAMRGIDATLAKRYLQQVQYGFEGKTYLALAFPNDNGGYETRSTRRFKGTLPPKWITLLHRDKIESCKAVTVFEGFMDYLSALAWYRRTEASTPVIILNSASMQERAIEVIRELGAEKVHLYLDRDTTGKRLTQSFIEALPGVEVIDQSNIYEGEKDFNAFLIDKQRDRSR